jgi:hypothetical protein
MGMKYAVNRAFSECDTCGHPRMAHFGGGCYCGCSGSVTIAEHDRGDLVETLTARVASFDRSSSSTWELVSEAAGLRRQGNPGQAVEVARAARDAAESLDEETVAATVEVAALCDLRRDEEARTVGEAALRRHTSPFLLNALGRAWWLGFVATRGIEEFRTRAEECFSSAASWNARASSSTAVA